jgi:hypothetical protein
MEGKMFKIYLVFSFQTHFYRPLVESKPLSQYSNHLINGTRVKKILKNIALVKVRQNLN